MSWLDRLSGEEEYELRNPIPNRYRTCFDTDYKMLECPKCECRITASFFSYAVGDNGYGFCPYCGEDLREKSNPKVTHNKC